MLTLHHFGAAGSRDVQGNLGTTVLERFKCTFDCARGTLRLEPGRRHAECDHFSRSGIFVTRWSGRVWVAGVKRHSPAAGAWLEVRDELRAVDGRPIEHELVDRDFELTLADVL